eukprot:scpid108305/ scgid14210/ 
MPDLWPVSIKMYVIEVMGSAWSRTADKKDECTLSLGNTYWYIKSLRCIDLSCNLKEVIASCRNDELQGAGNEVTSHMNTQYFKESTGIEKEYSISIKYMHNSGTAVFSSYHLLVLVIETSINQELTTYCVSIN